MGKGLMVTPGYTSGTALPARVPLPGRYLLKWSFNLIFISLDGFCCLNLALAIQRGLVVAVGFGFPCFRCWPVWDCCCGLFAEVCSDSADTNGKTWVGFSGCGGFRHLQVL